MGFVKNASPEVYSWASGKVTSLVKPQDPSSEISFALNVQGDEIMAGVTQEELNARLDALRAESKIDGAELRADFERFRAEFAEMRGDIKSGFEAVRVDMHKANTETLKWVVGTIFAGVTLIVSVTSFILSNVASKNPNASSSQPIVIQVPVPGIGGSQGVAPPALQYPPEQPKSPDKKQ